MALIWYPGVYVEFYFCGHKRKPAILFFDLYKGIFQKTVLSLRAWYVAYPLWYPFSFCLTPPRNSRRFSWWLPCLLSLGSSSVCAVSLYVKKSSLLILWSVTRLPLCNGQWATGPGLPYRSVHSCPPLPEWSHITYLWSRTELVSTYYRE